MSRHSRGVTFIAARSWLFIFTFAFIASFFTPQDSSALALDPILDDVFSLIRRNQADTPQKPTSEAADRNKNDNTPGDASSDGLTPAERQAPGNGSTVVEAPIVAEPLTELPVLDSSEMLAQPIRTAKPQPVTPTSSTVLGASDAPSIMPVQATSQGWKFFGVAWFWWLLAGLAGYYFTRQLIASYRRKVITQKAVVS